MSDHHLEHRNYLIFAAFFIIVSFLIMKSFLSGMLWGAVTALSVWPFLEKLAHKRPLFIKSGVANNALAFTIIFMFLFFLPIAYAVNEIAIVYSLSQTYIDNHTIHGNIVPPKFIQYLPMNAKIFAFWEEHIAHSAGIIDMLNKLTNGKLVSYFTFLGGEIIDRSITVLVMIVTFYLMIKNGQRVKNSYKDVFAHWIGERSVDYIDNGVQALRGTINGVVLIGIIEGALLAIPLVMGGMTSGVLIGLIAGILGVIPLLMPALILPCLAYMYLSGESTWAIIGLIDLAIVWFIFENILKPKVISQTVKINTFIILISMIGGMQLFGPVGLFLGPAIVSMAIGMIQDFLVVPKYFEHPITPKSTTENILDTIATVKGASNQELKE